MKIFTTVLSAGVILLAPAGLNAQRVGMSISSVGSPPSGSSAATANRPSVPQMPPLPRPLPAATAVSPTVVSLPSLQFGLKPLNLSSTHLTPPTIVSPSLAAKPASKPALPFALDPVAQRGFGQMCVDSTPLKH